VHRKTQRQRLTERQRCNHKTEDAEVHRIRNRQCDLPRPGAVQRERLLACVLKEKEMECYQFIP
jgi:hypothetical protein